MTVCIGAVCCDKKGNPRSAVVVASDRMVTMGQITEFEHEIPKVTDLTDQSVALVAGDALRGTRIVREIISHFKSTGGASITEIAAETANRYAALRLEQVDNDIFRPRGITVRDFYTGLQQHLNHQLVIGLDNLAVNLNFGVELLIAGVDGQGGHLFHIVNPGGSYIAFDHTGFGAIGSGSLHAVQSMIQMAHAPTHGLHETVFAVYASKRRAEVAPGVGSDTDMAIIDSDGIHRLDSKLLDGLAEAYKAYSQPIKDELLADVRKLELISPPAAEEKK